MYTMKLFLVFLYSLAINIEHVHLETNNLKFVFNIISSGARSPSDQVIKRKDILGNEWIGDNRLTEIGKRQMFLIGMQYRLRYVNDLKFLSSSFNSSEIVVKSMDMNRTITSTYALLTGFFPPYTGPLLNSDQLKNAIPHAIPPDHIQIQNTLQWGTLPNYIQIFPIHIFSKKEKIFNLIDKEYCEGVEEIQNKNKNNSNVINIQNKFNNKYGHIKRIMNFSDDFFNNYENLYLFCDSIMTSFFDQRNLSFLYVNSTLINKDCNEFLNLDKFYVNLNSEKDLLINVAMTRSMKRLISSLDDYIKLDNKKLLQDVTKFKIYSINIHNLVLYLSFFKNNLKITKELNFDFGANIVIEFYRKHGAPEEAKESDFEIILFYLGEQIYQDSYKNFKASIKSVLVSESVIDDFCGFTDNSGLYYTIAICLLASVNTGLGIWMLLLFIGNKPTDPNLLPT